MPFDTRTLIWLFPIAYMFHDFEELILVEPWLRQYGAEVKDRLQGSLPAFLAEQVYAGLDKSSAQLTAPISLIFTLTALASYLAAEHQRYRLYVWATGVFFLHGILHIWQAVMFRRYIPALITSLLIILPYGLTLYPRLIHDGIINLQGLLITFLLAAALAGPFLLFMHKIGDSLYNRAVRLLIG
jgi:hypothetical protein